MKGMKNIAEHGKKPLGSQAKPVFFPVRKILTNFALAKDRQKQRSLRRRTGEENSFGSKIHTDFQSRKGNG